MLEADEERFEELFQKYQSLIIQVALRMTGDLFCAQDICQDTFMKLFIRMNLGEEERVLKAWMIVVAENEAKDVLKKGGRYTQICRDDVETIESPHVCTTDKNEYDGIFRRDFLVQTLEHLKRHSEEQYEIVKMICWQGMTLDETAKRLDMSYSQVSMKLHRAREWLRKNYGEEYRSLK